MSNMNRRDQYIAALEPAVDRADYDDAPILNFCRTFDHHRSPSPANQYCRCRTLSLGRLLSLYQIAHQCASPQPRRTLRINRVSASSG
jgi:hypothetical protein